MKQLPQLMRNISIAVEKFIAFNLHNGNPRGHHNLILVMEELAELTKEISKELCGKGDSVSINLMRDFKIELVHVA